MEIEEKDRGKLELGKKKTLKFEKENYWKEKASRLFGKESTASQEEESVADALTLKHALASLASMFKLGSKEVEREYIETVWLDAKEDEEVVEEKGAPEDMETQPHAGDAYDLKHIIEYKIEGEEEEKLAGPFECGSEEIED